MVRLRHIYNVSIYFTAGVLNPLATDSRPIRNWAALQEVSSGQVSEVSSVFAAAPRRWHRLLRSTSNQQALDSYRSTGPKLSTAGLCISQKNEEQTLEIQ